MKKRGTRKGGYYGFNGGLATGTPNWGTGTEMGKFTVDQINNGAKMSGGRRRRKTKRRKTKKRGGSKYGAVAATYTGTGVRGMANYEGTSVNRPGVAARGEFNDGGAKPGDHQSFSGMFPK